MILRIVIQQCLLKSQSIQKHVCPAVSHISKWFVPTEKYSYLCTALFTNYEMGTKLYTQVHKFTPG
jgi:hypothetical protein